jgi:hypothetical protein
LLKKQADRSFATPVDKLRLSIKSKVQKREKQKKSSKNREA